MFRHPNDSVQWEAKITIQCKLNYVKRYQELWALIAAEQRREDKFSLAVLLRRAKELQLSGQNGTKNQSLWKCENMTR